MKRILLLLILFLFLTNCSAIKINDQCTNIERKYFIDVQRQLNGCFINVYLTKAKNEKLEGCYQFKDDDYLIIANFKNGVLNGEYIKKNKKYFQQNYYINGIKDSIEITKITENIMGNEIEYFYIIEYERGVANGDDIEYRNNLLFRKTHYNNSIKTGKEFYFNHFGDTITTLNYSFDQHYPKPFYLYKEHPEFSAYNYKGKIKVTREGNFNYDTWEFFNYIVNNNVGCMEKEFYLVETDQGTWSILVSSYSTYYHKID